MKTLITRQLSPAEMDEIRKDLFRAKGNAAVVAQLHACKVDELREALGDEAVNYQWPHGRKRGGLTGIGVPRTGIWSNRCWTKVVRLESAPSISASVMLPCTPSSGGGGDKEDTMDKQCLAGLPNYCYSIGPKTRRPVMIYRGDSTMYGVNLGRQEREMIDALNAKHGVDRRTEAAMVGGATKGWGSPYADPAHYDDEGCYIGIREGDIDG